MKTLMAREGRTPLTRILDYKPSRNRPNTSLVRLNAIFVPSTDDLNGLSRGHHVAGFHNVCFFDKYVIMILNPLGGGGGGLIPVRNYTGRLHPKGYLFQDGGRDFMS